MNKFMIFTNVNVMYMNDPFRHDYFGSSASLHVSIDIEHNSDKCDSEETTGGDMLGNSLVMTNYDDEKMWHRPWDFENIKNEVVVPFSHDNPDAKHMLGFMLDGYHKPIFKHILEFLGDDAQIHAGTMGNPHAVPEYILWVNDYLWHVLQGIFNSFFHPPSSHNYKYVLALTHYVFIFATDKNDDGSWMNDPAQVQKYLMPSRLAVVLPGGRPPLGDKPQN